MIQSSATNKETTMQSPRKHPRTLEEAFGPYTRGSIEEPYTPMTLADKVVMVISVIIGAVLLAAIFTGII
jgi:hypothetical protein